MSQQSIIDISFEGGLDITSNAIQLYNTPGAATELQNFESSIYGGYRRINGYTMFGDTQPAGTASEIFGVIPYADGVVACQGTSIYFSTDGTTWEVINKDLSTPGNLAALQAATELPRNSQGRCQFSIYYGASEYGILLISDGVNEVGYFQIVGIGGARTFQYKELGTATAAPQAPHFSTIYKERLVLAGDSTFPNQVFWSNRYEVDSFTGASAGFVDIGEKITAIKSFRERLFIFSRNSIFVLDNIDGAPSLQPVTTNIGCLCGFSIQEIGGDIIFLAPDGIRTLGATSRIGDVALSIVSSKITPIVNDIVATIATSGCVSSTVIREKNQYRLFYSIQGNQPSGQKGIIGTLKVSQTGGLTWEWSETLGLEVTALSSKIQSNSTEDIYHGGYDGYIYLHDSGNDFNGTAINARFKTPDIHYGNVAVRKTIHAVNLTMRSEGSTTLWLDLLYNFGSSLTHNPDRYTLNTVSAGALIGSMIIGSFTLGSELLPSERVLVEGGGYSNSFRFSTEDSDAPYTLNGMSVEFVSSNKLR